MCERPATFLSVWAPKPEYMIRELGGTSSSSRRIIYRTCATCAERARRDPQFVDLIERKIIAGLRDGSRVHRIE
jgi:hypothetical protein